MSRKEPISLEELLQKRESDREKQARPQFLSKEERQRLALERRAQQVKQNGQKPVASTSFADIPVETKKHRVGKPTSRNGKTLKFEWSDDEDTSGDYKPLVNVLDVKQDLPETMDLTHWSEKPLSKMTSRDWRILREDFGISSKGGNIPNPLRSWDESEVDPLIVKAIQRLGYHEPTPIQRAAVPLGLTGRDVLGIAETGSGKTLSFLIPIINFVLAAPRLDERNYREGPYCLIIVPTRELALQIETEFLKFVSKELNFRVASLIGGHTMGENINKIADGVEVVVATPGRLVDCLERRVLVLNQCFFLVMDEADKMINLGFEEQVKKILQSLPPGQANPFGIFKGPPRRTTMMFTATMPPAIEALSRDFLVHPGTVTVGEVGDAVESVVQEVEFIKGEEKRLDRLISILDSQAYRPPIIVFVNYKKTCELIAERLHEHNWHPVVMHGSKSQEQREAAIEQIKNGQGDVLVATDVAGRGIDIKDVSLVINFQMSRSIEDYTHRIGRTGRAGKRGKSITFLGDEDNDVLYDLKHMISKSPLSVVPSELKRHPYTQRKLNNITL